MGDTGENVFDNDSGELTETVSGDSDMAAPGGIGDCFPGDAEGSDVRGDPELPDSVGDNDGSDEGLALM